jgi:glutamyl-tRNA reductase
MSLLACGINHQTAPLSLREKVVFTADDMPRPLLDLVQHTQVSEAAILSTCNRTEIYCASNDPVLISDWLHQHHGLSAEQLKPHLYFHRDQAAVRHMLRVASGLDSMILGEPQILGQVKTAFSWAQSAGTLGTKLQRLFQYVFSASKQVRSETEIGAHPVSFAFAAVHLAKRIFADLSKLSVLLIGAGETIASAAQHLQSVGIKKFYIANRTPTHTEKLMMSLRRDAIYRVSNLEDMAKYLSQTDIVIAATESLLPLVGKGAVERALKIRKHKPMLMIDFAVPRNIEAEIAQLDDVYLYSLDDLQAIIQQNQQHRQQAAQQAEVIVEQYAARYMNTLKELEAVPAIRTYRAEAEKLRDAELAKALRLLQTGTAPEEALQRLANTLTNKLLHVPTVKLRKESTAI